jgi:hypothetical protein
LVDELYLYERVLPQQEIAAKAGLNIPPVVDAGEPKKIILPTASITLDGSASDTDAFAVLWSVVEGPGGVSFAPANNAVTTATFTQVGDYILRLTGTDSYNATAFDDVCVKVRPAGFDGMEAYLQFENADPNLALVSTIGLGYAGTAYGDPNAGTVEVGSAKSKLGSGALNLFGVDEYVEYSKFLGSNPSLTVSAWFNCRDVAAGGRIIDKWSNSGSGLGWMIRVRNDDSRLGAMIGSAYNGPGTYLLSPTAVPVAANEWVHAVLTFDAGVMRLYQNGALLNEETEVPFSPAEFITPVNIGRRNNSTEYFNGLIDEVRIYDYALSIAQVKALYAGDGGLPWNTCINSTLAGDLTQDCRVDMQDMAALSTDWQSTYNITTLTSVAQTWLDCDDLDLSKCL